MAFEFDKLNWKKMEEETKVFSRFSKKVKQAWCELLKCSDKELEALIGDDGKLHFDPRVPILTEIFDPREEWLSYNGDNQQLLLEILPIESYPAYIFQPLQVLDQWESDFFPQAVKELEAIITKGEMTFTKDFPLGFSGINNVPFMLSNYKGTIIMLASTFVFEKNKKDGILTADGFACYIPDYEIEYTVYPVIMINMEDLEKAYNRKRNKAAKIIAAYQNDILESFAYELMNIYANWFKNGLSNIYGQKENITQAHRDSAVAFAKRYMDNK